MAPGWGSEAPLVSVCWYKTPHRSKELLNWHLTPASPGRFFLNQPNSGSSEVNVNTATVEAVCKGPSLSAAQSFCPHMDLSARH